jgi:hypothetical protein
MLFGTNNAERMRIDSSGNVGIGTSTNESGFKLHVVGNAFVQNTSGQTTGKVVVDSADNRLVLGSYFEAGVGQYSFISSTDNAETGNIPLLFRTGTTERMRIDSSGNFLVGTSNTSLVSGNTSNTGTSISFGSVISARSDFEPLYLNKLGSDGNAASFWKAGTFVGSISVTSSATAYNTSSDYRLKHNVHPMVSGLSTIAALKPSTYKWNADNSYGEGFIAHELQAVIPLAVSGEKDAINEDGSIKPQGVDYSKVVVHLVAAIQELKADNDAMKERIATLEAK